MGCRFQVEATCRGLIHRGLALVLALVWQLARAEEPVELGLAEPAQARSLMTRSRSELTPQQWALLSTRLAETEAAYTAFAQVTAVSEQAAAALTGTGVTAAGADGALAYLSTIAEVLPVLLAVWPSTAHAPGQPRPKPSPNDARVRLETSLKALAQAAHQIERERAATSPSRDAGLDPPGACTEKEHADLSQAVGRTCKTAPMRCTKDMSCEDLRANLHSFHQCIEARMRIMVRCFRGGDERHQRVVAEAKRGMERCAQLLREAGCDPQGGLE